MSLQMSLLEQQFQLHLGGWMGENVFRFINFKAKANCIECLEGKPFSQEHYCWELGPKYHSRLQLLGLYSEAFESVKDMMKSSILIEDLQSILHINLIQDGFRKEDIHSINTEDNIVAYGQCSAMYEYIFNTMWTNHPAGFICTPMMPLMPPLGQYTPDDEPGNYL